MGSRSTRRRGRRARRRRSISAWNSITLLPNQGRSNRYPDVQFDPVNKLFLVAQPVSSTAGSGSSIHVYDVAGNLIESINGLSFSNAGNVVPAHIALNPRKRIGFVDGPDPGVSQIQSFTY